MASASASRRSLIPSWRSPYPDLRAGGATAQFRPEYFNLAFDPEILKLVVVDMLHEAGVRILLHTMVVGALMDGDRVTGVVIENKSGRQAVLADPEDNIFRINAPLAAAATE